MIIYWIICIISMILAWLCMHTKSYLYKEKIMATIIISCLPLLLLSALRYGVGTDYNEYIAIYNIYTSRGMRGTYEPIFYALGYGLTRLHANGQWLIASCSLIYVLLIFLCIYKESPNPIFSIFLLVASTFYMSSFNTMREHVGASILLLALLFLIKKKYILFILLCIIAAGFHYSCILFLIVLLFVKVKMTPKKVILTTAVFIISRPLFALIVNKVLARTVYARYLRTGEANGAAMYLGMVFQFAILIFASFFYKKDDYKYNLFYSIQVIATWITLLNGIIPLVSRIRWIFSLPGIILIPMVIDNIQEKKTRQIAFFAVSSLFFIYANIVVGIVGSYGVVPYKSIFLTNY